MRRLIVNADDLGMTTGINRGIVEGCEKGIITSTTLMANSRAFDDAIARVQDLNANRTRASVGCHLVLLDGIPVLPPERVSSLLQPTANKSDPQLRVSLTEFARAALMGRLRPDEIEAEADAQIKRTKDAGIAVSHVDSHKHAHMFPAVLRPILRAARGRGVFAVRNPFGALFPLSLRRTLRSPRLWKRLAELGVLHPYAAGFLREVRQHGLRTPDGLVGVAVTGTLDMSSFLDIADCLPEGTWEFVCHPGYVDAELDQVRTRLRQSRQQELQLLTSPEAKAALQRRGIDLISYHEL